MAEGYRPLITERWRGLLTGELKPWELPEFKGMEYTLAKRGALARKGTGRELRRRGIRGPAVASALRGMEESETAPLGDVMRSTYGALPGQASQWAASERGMDIQEKLGLGQLREIRKMRRARTPSDFEKGFGMVSSMCILTTACYGADSVEVAAMREVRDYCGGHPVAKKIIRGYYVFSDLLLPLMKYRAVKEVVRVGLVDSLINALIRKIGWKVKTWRMPFDSVVAYASLNLWRIMGSRRPYTRKNGEVV